MFQSDATPIIKPLFADVKYNDSPVVMQIEVDVSPLEILVSYQGVRMLLALSKAFKPLAKPSSEEQPKQEEKKSRLFTIEASPPSEKMEQVRFVF